MQYFSGSISLYIYTTNADNMADFKCINVFLHMKLKGWKNEGHRNKNTKNEACEMVCINLGLGICICN